MYKHAACCVLLGLLAGMPAAAEPATPLAGQVLDENNRPLAGARVAAFGAIEGVDSPHELATTTTDSEGRFRFDESTAEKCVLILTTQEGRCLDWAYPAVVRNPDLTLRLGPATRLEGAIVDEADKPVAGVAVEASVELQREYISPGLSSGLLKTKTDSEGRFRFDNFPSEASVALDMTAPGYARALAEGPFSPGQKGLRFVLPPEGRMEGIVVEKATGKPLADVWVQARGSVTSGQYHAKSKTDAEGRFCIAGLSGGKYELEIVGPDDATLPEWLRLQEQDDKTPPFFRQGVPVETGKTTSAVKIEATQGARLEVALVDAATGRPITAKNADVTVCLAKDVRITHSELARSNGLASLCLLPGTYMVREVMAPGYRYSEESSKHFQVEIDKTTRVTVPVEAIPPRATVSSVRDLAGDVVPGARVHMIRMVGPPKDIVAGNDGQFSIDAADMEPLVCFLLIRHPKQNFMALGFAAHEQVPSQITLLPPRTVSGIVVDSQHQPIVGAKLQVQIDASHMGRYGIVATAQTDKQGRYAIELVGNGITSYVISAKAPGHGTGEVMVEATELPGIELPDGTPEQNKAIRAEMTRWMREHGGVEVKELVLLASNRVVHATVKDKQGKPVPGAVLTAKRLSGPEFPGCVVSDAEGRCTLEHLDDSESIYLFARVPGRGWIDHGGGVNRDEQEVVITVGPSSYD